MIWYLKDWRGVRPTKDGVIVDFTFRNWFTEEEVKTIEQNFISDLGKINCHDVKGENRLRRK